MKHLKSSDEGTNRVPRKLAKSLLIMGVALFAVFAITFIVTSCTSPREDFATEDYAGEDQETYEEVIIPPYYDEAGFSFSANGRASYSGKHGSTNITGVDVSEMQDDIDWSAVKEDGISFAMIRIGYRGMTEGKLFEDSKFENNFAGATDAGIKCGAYFFSQAITEAEAVEEANFILEKLGGRHLDYPVALDLEATKESRAFGKDPRVMSGVARAFCEPIRKAGYDVFIYGNSDDLAYVLKEEKLNDFDTWYAQYDVAPGVTYKCRMWQYSNTGSVSGISGEVDLNLDLSPLN